MDEMGKKFKALAPDQRPDFCVRIDFERGARNPERIFRSAACFIESLQNLDVVLIHSVDSKIKPVLLLEEIEAGSIKIWLKQFLEATDDENLKNLEWKPALGKFLVLAKHKVLGYLGDKKGLESAEGLRRLASELHGLAQTTDVRKFPIYRPVSPSDIAQQMRSISEALAPLGEAAGISIESEEGKATVPGGVIITQGQITDILAGESITNEVERILMVRKPDFLGDSMWEFRYEKKSFAARIDDENWINDFRSGNQVIRPGDALRVKCLETTTYGKDGEVLSENRSVAKVLGIIRETLFPLPVE